MGKPYSLDLRERICAHIAEGNSARSAGRLFGGERSHGGAIGSAAS